MREYAARRSKHCTNSCARGSKIRSGRVERELRCRGQLRGCPVPDHDIRRRDPCDCEHATVDDVQLEIDVRDRPVDDLGRPGRMIARFVSVIVCAASFEPVIDAFGIVAAATEPGSGLRASVRRVSSLRTASASNVSVTALVL